MQKLIKNFLIHKTNLIVRLFKFQTFQCLAFLNKPVKIKLNCVKNFVVCNSAFNYVIIQKILFSPSAVQNKIKPFLIVFRKFFESALFFNSRIIKFIDIHKRFFTDSQKTLNPFFSLALQIRNIKTFSKIKIFPAEIYERIFYRNR